LEFNVPFQHKYGYIRDEDVGTYVQTDAWTFETHFIRSTQKSRPNHIIQFSEKLWKQTMYITSQCPCPYMRTRYVISL